MDNRDRYITIDTDDTYGDTNGISDADTMDTHDTSDTSDTSDTIDTNDGQ